MIYPGAFNLTTGPLHWELLQRARYARWVFCMVDCSSRSWNRAVDNQIYVSMCSPARDMTAGYHAVRMPVISTRIQTKLRILVGAFDGRGPNVSSRAFSGIPGR